MTQAEIYQNMTKGEWSEFPLDTVGIEAYVGDEDCSYLIGSFGTMQGISPLTKTANNLAAIDAVNNTYHKCINPEGVEKMKTILQDIIENSDSGLIIRPGSYTYKAIEEALTAIKL